MLVADNKVHIHVKQSSEAHIYTIHLYNRLSLNSSVLSCIILHCICEFTGCYLDLCLYSSSKSTNQPGSITRWCNVSTAALGAWKWWPGRVLHHQVAETTVASSTAVRAARHSRHRTHCDWSCTVLNIRSGSCGGQQHRAKSSGFCCDNNQWGWLDILQFLVFSNKHNVIFLQ